MKIIQHERDSFLVSSESELDSFYLIDLAGDEQNRITCTCDSFVLGKNKQCKHIINFLNKTMVIKSVQEAENWFIEHSEGSVRVENRLKEIKPCDSFQEAVDHLKK